MDLPFAVSPDDVLAQPTRASLFSMLGELKRPAEAVHPHAVGVQGETLGELATSRPPSVTSPASWP